MEEIEFKIQKDDKLSFENDFRAFLLESKGTCHQMEWEPLEKFVVAKIPEYCLKKLTEDQLRQLESYCV